METVVAANKRTLDEEHREHSRLDAQSRQQLQRSRSTPGGVVAGIVTKDCWPSDVLAQDSPKTNKFWGFKALEEDLKSRREEERSIAVRSEHESLEDVSPSGRSHLLYSIQTSHTQSQKRDWRRRH